MLIDVSSCATRGQPKTAPTYPESWGRHLMIVRGDAHSRTQECPLIDLNLEPRFGFIIQSTRRYGSHSNSGGRMPGCGHAETYFYH